MNFLNKAVLTKGVIVNDEKDPLLEELRGAVSPIIDRIEQDIVGNHAALVIAGKEITVNGEYAGIKTVVDICGDYGILGEALYSEMMEQIQTNNNSTLFNLLREVVKTIEQELELAPDEPFSDEPKTFH